MNEAIECSTCSFRKEEGTKKYSSQCQIGFTKIIKNIPSNEQHPCRFLAIKNKLHQLKELAQPFILLVPEYVSDPVVINTPEGQRLASFDGRPLKKIEKYIEQIKHNQRL